MSHVPSSDIHSAAHNGCAGRAAPDGVPLVHLSDFVDRPAIEIDQPALSSYLGARTVLVTGAGGSVGTELSAQLLHAAPKRLVLADVSEHNLFRLEQRLPPSPHTKTSFSLVDVRDHSGVRQLFADARPDLVIHAAAYKHVHLVERHPVAGFQNNTLATRQLIEVAAAHGTEQFVFVSTDKAVAPASVLGVTKRLAEWLTRTSGHRDMTSKVVRFGNVFGSRGSVVPQFQRQLARGEPLEVTHPDMQRYFMSVEDAARLILQTLLLDAAPIYALKMGEPVSILWLARQMIRRCLSAQAPDDLIVFTGKRPGEKLREQLFSEAERAFPTEHPCIMGLAGGALPDASVLDALIDDLRQCAERRPGALRAALLEAGTAAGVAQRPER